MMDHESPGKQNIRCVLGRARPCRVGSLSLADELAVEPVPTEAGDSADELARRVLASLEQLGYAGQGVVLAVASRACLCSLTPACDASQRDRRTLTYRLEEYLPLAAEAWVADFVLRSGCVGIGVASPAGHHDRPGLGAVRRAYRGDLPRWPAVRASAATSPPRRRPVPHSGNRVGAPAACGGGCLPWRCFTGVEEDGPVIPNYWLQVKVTRPRGRLARRQHCGRGPRVGTARGTADADA